MATPEEIEEYYALLLEEEKARWATPHRHMSFGLGVWLLGPKAVEEVAVYFYYTRPSPEPVENLAACCWLPCRTLAAVSAENVLRNPFELRLIDCPDCSVLLDECLALSPRVLR